MKIRRTLSLVASILGIAFGFVFLFLSISSLINIIELMSDGTSSSVLKFSLSSVLILGFGLSIVTIALSTKLSTETSVSFEAFAKKPKKFALVLTIFQFLIAIYSLILSLLTHSAIELALYSAIHTASIVSGIFLSVDLSRKENKKLQTTKKD